MKCPYTAASKLLGRTIEIGYIYDNVIPEVLHFPLEKVTFKQTNPTGAVQRCIAIQERVRNIYMLRSPMTFSLFLTKLSETNFLLNVNEQETPAHLETFQKLFSIADHNRRDMDKFVFQFLLGIAFISDTPGVTVTTSMPYLEYTNWPGLLYPGQFNIYDWPARMLNFPFEWHDASRSLTIKRGDPLMYFEFQAEKNIKIIPKHVERTPQIDKVINQTSGVVQYLNKGTHSLFPIMRERRPKKLLP